MSDFGISHEVIAVRPFYRGPAHAAEAKAIWKNYFTMPGNVGLPFAGEFLAAQLMSAIRRKHRAEPFNVIHAQPRSPAGTQPPSSASASQFLLLFRYTGWTHTSLAKPDDSSEAVASGWLRMCIAGPAR